MAGGGVGGATGGHCLEESPAVGCSRSPGAIGLGFGVPSKPQGQAWGYRMPRAGGQETLRAEDYRVAG